MEEAIVDFEPVPARHRLEAPCCGAQVSIDERVYEWPVGFARFVLDIWNPDPPPDGLDSVTRRLTASVGSPRRAIWAQY
jgi:hypothetical protein